MSEIFIAMEAVEHLKTCVLALEEKAESFFFNTREYRDMAVSILAALRINV